MIGSESLRDRVAEAWVLGLERGGWPGVEDVPYARNVHEASAVEHVRGVARIALEAATVQRAIPHYLGEVPTRTLEAELVVSANEASSNGITRAAMGITLEE